MTNKEQDETVESDAELRSRLSTIFDCELDHRLDAAMTLIEAHYKAKYEVKEPSYDGRSRPLIVMRNYFTRYNHNHKRRKNKMPTFDNYSTNESGDVIGYRKGETIKDYQDLANAMSMGEHSNYPVGLSPCFVAGINGDWEDDGYCPVSKIDPRECTCEDEFKAPKEWRIKNGYLEEPNHATE